MPRRLPLACPLRGMQAISAWVYGWAGAAKTYFWVDPQEDLVGVFMSQSMVGIELAEQDLRALAYQAIVD